MNGTNNKDNLKVFDLDFDDLYQFQHIQLALADLISKDDPNRPIIAAHPIGCNNISELSEKLISQEDKKKINQALKQDGSAELSKNKVKKQLKELSKNAVKEEFNAIFALVDARERPVLYIRWMPKDDELFAATRPNHKGHFVCLYFFHDHNNEKSILIANPNGMGITEESEINVTNSYLEKNPAVKIYQSQDYTQFGQSGCGPGALVLLRMLYNMSKQELKGVLEKGEKKTFRGNNQFNFTIIKLGDDALQKEIGKIPQKNTQEEKDVDQKVRYADYATAKVCKEHNDAIKNNDCVAIALADIPFDQELIKNLTKDQATLLSKLLLSGKQLLTPEQIQQAQQERDEILGIQEKRAEKSEFSKILAATVAFAAVALLCSAIFIDMKKEFKIGGIALSSVMLISAITCFFLPGKTLDSKLCVNLTNPKIETTPILQQLPQK